MAAKPKDPVYMLVIIDGETKEFFLNDSKDWSVFADNVLEVKTAKGPIHYFPIDSVTQWIIQNQPLNGHA